MGARFEAPDEGFLAVASKSTGFFLPFQFSLKCGVPRTAKQESAWVDWQLWQFSDLIPSDFCCNFINPKPLLFKHGRKNRINLYSLLFESNTPHLGLPLWRKVPWLLRQERVFRLVLISWHAMNEIWMWRIFWVVLAYIYLIKGKKSLLSCIVTRYQNQPERLFLTKKIKLRSKHWPYFKLTSIFYCNCEIWV